MSLSALNQCVTCLSCGNDFVFTVGGDAEVNTLTAAKWLISVDVKSTKPKRDCCDARLDISFNNMMIGVQLFADMNSIPIVVAVSTKYGDEE